MQQAEAMRLFNLVCQERDQAQRACAEKDDEQMRKEKDND
jgi:hypothetical protein